MNKEATLKTPQPETPLIDELQEKPQNIVGEASYASISAHEAQTIKPTKLVSTWLRTLFGWPIIVILITSLSLGPLTGLGQWGMIKLTLLLIGQNFAFTFVSRARQSSSLTLHAIAAVFSNGLFIYVLTLYAANYDNGWMKLWYVVCTTVGSLYAHHISLHKIEKMKSFEKDSMVSRRDLEKAILDTEQKLRKEFASILAESR